MVTDVQVKKLKEEFGAGAGVGVAALRSGMHRNTARGYLSDGRLPTDRKVERNWRTREDPFVEEWPLVELLLSDAPELEAKALFEHLQSQHPDRYLEGQLRTFQRRVKQWRVECGPDKEVFLAQAHRPGESLQTDFTYGSNLGVTIGGAAFGHLLCHSVLPFSNWQSVTVAKSESMLALRHGIQTALFRLGRAPEFSQTDNSTSATHDLRTGKRGFNQEYVEFLDHFGIRPRTIGVGECQQNGDVEALNGALKRRLKQHFLLRGSRDFESVDAYESWIGSILDRANELRRDRLANELAVMPALKATRLAKHRELRLRVSSHGTIQVLRNTYSVPSRLRGERVVVRVSDLDLVVYYGGREQYRAERLRGERKSRIDYRHVVWSLLRKPGGFARYRYRDEMFPSDSFRRAHELLGESFSERSATMQYLRILHLAATTMESDVEVALRLLLCEGQLPTFEKVEALVSPPSFEPPELEAYEADLTEYDCLLEGVA